MTREEQQPTNQPDRFSPFRGLFTIFIVFLASLLFSVLAAEGLLRLFYAPIDYLSPILIPDEILSYHVQPKSAHHDAWGFRNPTVPAQVDIVTIGDSQTYGWLADHNHTWPALLQQMTGRSVYNLAMGRYGPPQYLYLFEKYALKLHPQQIIIGLYIGNDFVDSYNMIYGFDYWKQWRNPQHTPEGYLHDLVMDEVKANYPSWRTWLKSHSMILRMLNIPWQHLQNRSRNNVRLNPKYTFVSDDQKKIHTGFKSLIRNSPNDPKTQEGMRIGLGLLDQIYELCQQQGLNFTVVVITTKYLIFSNYIEQHPNLRNFQALREISTMSRRLYDDTIAHLQEQGIPYVDTNPAFIDAIGKVELYPNDLDDHPTVNGYRIIAECVQRSLMNTP